MTTRIKNLMKFVIVPMIVFVLVSMILSGCQNMITQQQQDQIIGMPLFNFAVGLSWAIFGICVNVFSDIARRNKFSKNSPILFSLKYWWKDNKYRMIASILMMPIAIIGFKQLFQTELSQLNAFAIGFYSDHIAEILKRRSVIGKQQDNKNEQENNTEV